MKKHFLHFLLSINLLSVFILSSFSIAKAEALTPGKVTTWGWYKAETYKQTSGQSGSASFDFGVIGITGLTVELPLANGTTSSVFHFTYVFKEPTTGYITLQVTGASTYYAKDTNFAVNGAYFTSLPDSTNNKTKSWTFRFTNTESVDFMIVAPASGTFDNTTTFTLTGGYGSGTDELDYLQDIANLVDSLDTRVGQIYGILSTYFDYKLSTMASTFSDILAELHSKNTYQVELQSLPAWVFASATYSNIYYDDGSKYPYVQVSANDVTKYMNFNPANTYYFYCMLSAGASTSNISMTNANVNVELYSLPYYRFNGGYRIWRFTYTVSGETEQVSAMRWGIDNNIIPLYFGDGRNMTVEMQSLLGVDSENLTTERLQQIIDLLTEIAGDELFDTTEYDDFIDDVGGFLNNLKNFFPTLLPFQTDFNSVPSFTGSNTHVDEMTGFVGDVYTGVSQAFPFVKTFIILGAVVLLMKVFL